MGSPQDTPSTRAPPLTCIARGVRLNGEYDHILLDGDDRDAGGLAQYGHRGITPAGRAGRAGSEGRVGGQGWEGRLNRTGKVRSAEGRAMPMMMAPGSQLHALPYRRGKWGTGAVPMRTVL